tara:strand:- start:440 stop:1249 length:810 start_codon:yes stop_codon:yes gene_type:complete
MIYLLLLFITLSILLILYVRFETFTGIIPGNNIFKETDSTKYLGMGICIKNKSFGYRSNDKCITLSDLKKQKEQNNQIEQQKLLKKTKQTTLHKLHPTKRSSKKNKVCTPTDYNGFGDCVKKDESYCRKIHGKNYDQAFIKCPNNKVKYRCTKKGSEIKSTEIVTKCHPKLANFDDICNNEGWKKLKKSNYGVKNNTVYSKHLCPIGYSTATCSDLYQNYMTKYGDYQKISECIKINEIDNYVKENCASYNTRSGNYDCSVDKERVVCY